MMVDDKAAEDAAAACFRLMTEARTAHTQVDRLHIAWGEHPAYQSYIRDKALDHWLGIFLASGPLRAEGGADE